MESVIQKEKQCLICHIERGLHRHHVFFGSNHQVSEDNGFTVWLCGYHHNQSNAGVHFNRELDIEVRKYAQRVYEQSHTRAEFMDLIGVNYLDEEEFDE